MAGEPSGHAGGGLGDSDAVAYETAPRLTKGVRYRVVEASSDAELADGHEFVASGEEWIGASESLKRASTVVWAPFDGWYAMPRELGSAATVRGWYRVVRVEPEKTGKCTRCDGEGMLLPLRDGVPCPDCNDGGGERSGQTGWVTREGTAEGPEHPANVLARQALEREGFKVLPETKAVLPIDAEDERVVDALVHRRTADRAETPLLGPHAGTVADHERRLQRAENFMLRYASSEADEIRAERSGSGE